MADLIQSPFLACLFIDPAPEFEHPLGEPFIGPMIRFGAGTLLDQQLAALHASGAQEIAIMADRLVPGLNQILEQWRANGLSIMLFHDRIALFEWAKSSGTVLILAQNIIATAQTLAYAAAQASPTLFVRDAATSDERHERIDLNDRWTGIAVLPACYLAELPDLAEDWSLQSALLRHAVQKNVRRETMAIGPTAALQSEIIVDLGDVGRWQDRAMQQHFDCEIATATPFRRWISLPVARMALPLLWESQKEAAQLMTWGQYALLVMAFILALLQWLPAAYCLLIPLLLVEEIDRQYGALSFHSRVRNWRAQVYWAAWFAFPIIALMRVEGMALFSGFLLGGVVASAIAITGAVRPAVEPWVAARQEAVILALACAILGVTPFDTALLTSLTVLVSGFWRPIVTRLKAI